MIAAAIILLGLVFVGACVVVSAARLSENLCAVIWRLESSISRLEKTVRCAEKHKGTKEATE
jgi:hypothetical protein